MPAEEYSDAINHLMSDSKFLCHVWCYNVPGAVLVFTVLLCLCLSIIPLAEVRWLYRRSQSGLEFVHAVVVWLCVLAIYMIAIPISKKKARTCIRSIDLCAASELSLITSFWNEALSSNL